MNTFINTSGLKSNAKAMIKGHYGGAIVAVLAVFTASCLFGYLQTLIQVVFGMVDVKTGAYSLDFSKGITAGFTLGLLGMLLCSVASFLFTSPLSVGLIRYFWNFVSGNSAKVEQIFFYFSSGKKYLRALFFNIRLTFLKIMWGILCLGPGFALYAYGLYSSGVDISLILNGSNISVNDPMSLTVLSAGSLLLTAGGIIYLFLITRYFLANYIFVSDDEISAKNAITVAVKMAKGRVWQYICLYLSFIGWLLLSILTCGILLLFTVPYMYVTVALYAKTVIDINLNPPSFFHSAI